MKIDDKVSKTDWDSFNSIDATQCGQSNGIKVMHQFAKSINSQNTALNCNNLQLLGYL